MTSYRNLGGNSNVQAFEISAKYIKVKFCNTEKIYTYSYQSAGQAKVEEMKRLARQGHGLNAYIKRYANQDYEK